MILEKSVKFIILEKNHYTVNTCSICLRCLLLKIGFCIAVAVRWIIAYNLKIFSLHATPSPLLPGFKAVGELNGN
uniref:Uncharacterized protein n=1 Tax=Amphimedon queenslandica TaxID=400682 RepID=A0A1X7T5S9_AMPQE